MPEIATVYVPWAGRPLTLLTRDVRIYLVRRL